MLQIVARERLVAGTNFQKQTFSYNHEHIP